MMEIKGYSAFFKAPRREASSFDDLMSDRGYQLAESYSLAKMQSTYFTSAVDKGIFVLNQLALFLIFFLF